jgi:hypothetical protein
MPFGLLWDAKAPRAIEAELLRRFPYKAPSIHRDSGAVRFILADIATAWRCYHAGAVGALFDLRAFITEAQLALPDTLAGELDALARRALLGEGVTGGQGSRSPIDRHLAALRKRRRHHAMRWIIQTGQHYAEADDPRSGAVARGADAELVAKWQRERPEASAQSKRAAELAAQELGEGMVSWRAIYDDWREVDAAMRDRSAWPGIFYLPSQATCESLGWRAALHPLCDEEPSDAPAWVVA